MSKNKNNKPVWSSRISKDTSYIFQKVGGSLKIDRRLLCHDCYFKEKGVRNGQWSRNNIPRTTTYGPRK